MRRSIEVIRVNDNDSAVAAAARLQAMVTFKQRQMKMPNAEFINLELQVVKSREQTFNFGRIFANTLRDLESGEKKVPREIEEIFS